MKRGTRFAFAASVASLALIPAIAGASEPSSLLKLAQAVSQPVANIKYLTSDLVVSLLHEVLPDRQRTIHLQPFPCRIKLG